PLRGAGRVYRPRAGRLQARRRRRGRAAPRRRGPGGTREARPQGRREVPDGGTVGRGGATREVAEADTSLEGRVAIVTGSGSGLGAAEALELARSGAAGVVIHDVRPGEDADRVIADIEAAGARAALVVGDVSEAETANAMFTEAEKLGGVHVVVNNAGITRDKMLFNMSDE